MKTFFATAVGAVELVEDDTFALVLAETEHGGGQRLEVQISLSNDETDEDVALGLDTCCLCDETGACCYRCIVSWRVTSGVLTIGLDEAGVAVFDAGGGFEITFDAVHTDLVASSMARLTKSSSR